MSLWMSAVIHGQQGDTTQRASGTSLSPAACGAVASRVRLRKQQAQVRLRTRAKPLNPALPGVVDVAALSLGVLPMSAAMIGMDGKYSLSEPRSAGASPILPFCRCQIGQSLPRAGHLQG